MDTNDDKYLKQALSFSLQAILEEHYAQFEYSVSKTKLVYQMNSLEIIPYIERIVNQANEWHCGVRFEVLSNGEKRNEFTFGLVATGISIEDALVNSSTEWISYVGFPILDYFFNSESFLEVNKFKVSKGLTGLRGETPGEWLDGSDFMHIKLLNLILSESQVNSSVFSVSLMIIKNLNVNIKGECRINGQISESCLSSLKRTDWPNKSTFLLKQFYLIIPYRQ